jgi:3-hydroxyisobutyrate dehydrogenase-like beta-hydroxyacid dehydrogenase
VKPKLGTVGLGNMGEQICRRLLVNGYEVSIHDANPEAVSKLGDTSAAPAGSLRDLAATAAVVLLSLPNSDVVEEVVLGDGA